MYANTRCNLLKELRNLQFDELCKRPQFEPQDGDLEDPLLSLARTANNWSY